MIRDINISLFFLNFSTFMLLLSPNTSKQSICLAKCNSPSRRSAICLHSTNQQRFSWGLVFAQNSKERSNGDSNLYHIKSLNNVEGSHQPKSHHSLSSDVLELTLSVRLVVLKFSAVGFAVGEVERSLALLHIIFEAALVLDPLVIEQLKMTAVILFPEDAYTLVVEHSVAIQTILLPFSLIGDLPTCVIQHPPTFHPILHPLPAVLASFVVVKCSESMSILAKFIPFISTLFENLAYVFRIFINIFLLGRILKMNQIFLLLSLGLAMAIDGPCIEVVSVIVEVRAFTEDSLGVGHLLLIEKMIARLH